MLWSGNCYLLLRTSLLQYLLWLVVVWVVLTVCRLFPFTADPPDLSGVFCRLARNLGVLVQVSFFLKVLESFGTCVVQVHLLRRGKGLLSLVHHGVCTAWLRRDETSQQLLLLLLLIGLAIIRTWGCGLKWSKRVVDTGRHLMLWAEQLIWLILVWLLRYLSIG